MGFTRDAGCGSSVCWINQPQIYHPDAQAHETRDDNLLSSPAKETRPSKQISCLIPAIQVTFPSWKPTSDLSQLLFFVHSRLSCLSVHAASVYLSFSSVPTSPPFLPQPRVNEPIIARHLSSIKPGSTQGGSSPSSSTTVHKDYRRAYFVVSREMPREPSDPSRTQDGLILIQAHGRNPTSALLGSKEKKNDEPSTTSAVLTRDTGPR